MWRPVMRPPLSAPCPAFAEQEALDLARLGLGKLLDELDLARILMSAHARLDQLDDLRVEPRPPRHAGAKHHVCLDDLPAKRIGRADHGGLGHVGVTQDRALDLEGPDAVPRALDDVIAPALEPEVAVSVAASQIADRHPAAAPHRARALL